MLQRLRNQFALSWWGIHGVSHWARVAENAREIAKCVDDVDHDVLSWFAMFHDARRATDHADPDHGRRGAELARSMRAELGLDDDQMALLVDACAGHSEGLTTTDPTIGVCWDADRLDLPRVGVPVDTRLLSTESAIDLIPWAANRALRQARPKMLDSPIWTTVDPGPAGIVGERRRVHALEDALARQNFVSAMPVMIKTLRELRDAAEHYLAEAREGRSLAEAALLRGHLLDGYLDTFKAIHEAVALDRYTEILDELLRLQLEFTDEPRFTEPVLALRCCTASMTALVDRSFVWPSSGWVECDDYNGEPVEDACGMYAIAWGRGQTEPSAGHRFYRDCVPRPHESLASPQEGRWMVIRVPEGVYIPEGDRGPHGRQIKFGRAEVLHVADGIGPTSFDNAVAWLIANQANA